MNFRIFNAAGILKFREYLARLRTNSTLTPPVGLLADDELIREGIPVSFPDPVNTFSNRMEFAHWLYDLFSQAGIEIPRSEEGFWAWLSLALFDQVAPPDSGGNRKPGADARHIPELTNWRRRYRHLLANPVDVFLLHRDDPSRAAVVLLNPLNKPGELTEQFTARFELVSCPGTMALATRLYIDSRTGARRLGASGNSARRLGKLMNQYTRTWDLPEINPQTFAQILPKEFDRFK